MPRKGLPRRDCKVHSREGFLKMKTHHPLVILARRAIETYVRERRVIDPPEELTPEMRQRAGVFVSIKKGGQLRGCIGTFMPTQENVALEVIENAISAATRDPRFSPIGPQELPYLDVSVDVLSSPEPISGPEELDPKRYGVIVESGWKKGLLLPDLEGVDTVEQQLAIAMAKAGIGRGEKVKLYRFSVERFH